MAEGLQQTITKDARITARRKRVQDRLTSVQEGITPGGKQIENVQELSKSRQQLVESRKALLDVKLKSWLEVTTLRLKADMAATEHRLEEENKRQAMRGTLLEEAEQSAKDNAVACGRWDKLLSFEVPQTLFDEMKAQQELCQAIIKKKEGVIAGIKGELKQKDDDYVKLLKVQSVDVDNMLESMSHQATALKASLGQQLMEMEKAFVQERQSMLEANQKEISALLELRSKEEIEFLEKHLERIDQSQAKLDQLRLDDAEEYHNLKIKLETDVATLEQHLGSMRATYQLNTEKLEYNYRVLKEREMENQSTIHQQKRKISKLHDVLSSLKQRYVRMEEKFIHENEKLTDEYCRVTDQFKELQAKRSRFEKSDVTTYHKLWDMHTSEARRIIDKLLEADRVLHQQQLGLSWTPVTYALPPPPPHVRGMLATSRGHTASPDGSGLAAPEGPLDATSDAKPEGVQADEVEACIRDPAFQAHLQLLTDEAGFLAESTAQSLISDVPVNDEGLAKASSILGALGVGTGSAFRLLMDALSLENVGEDDEDILAAPSDVIAKLKDFIVMANRTPSRQSSGVIKSSATRAHATCSGREASMQRYWDHVATVGVDAAHMEMWRVLEAQLKRYYKVLQGRTACARDMELLRRRNEDLRRRLREQVSSASNALFQVPPTATMRVNDLLTVKE